MNKRIIVPYYARIWLREILFNEGIEHEWKSEKILLLYPEGYKRVSNILELESVTK